MTISAAMLFTLSIGTFFSLAALPVSELSPSEVIAYLAGLGVLISILISGLNAILGASKTSLKQLQANFDSLKTINDTLIKENQELRTDNAQLKTDNEALRKTNQELLTKMCGQDDKISRQDKQIKNLQGEIRRLKQFNHKKE